MRAGSRAADTYSCKNREKMRRTDTARPDRQRGAIADREDYRDAA